MQQNNDTSWQNLAKWYDSVTGKDGSELHQKLVIPFIIKLLKIKPGIEVLDIGCGNGVLAKEIVSRGAKYTGIDSSKSLIESAKRRDVKNARFYNFGATDVNLDSKIITKYDRGVFILSIQDINPLESAVMNLSKVMKQRSEVIIFMFHPAFKIPRQSGFVYDDNRKMISRRIDSYLSENAIPYKKDRQNRHFIADFYHRPLESYINTLSHFGFATVNIFELPNYNFDRLPPRYNDSNIKHIEKRVLKEIPVYMVIKAIKL